MVTTVPNQKGGVQFAIVEKDEVRIMFQSKESLVEEYEVLNTNIIKPFLSLFIKVNDIQKLYES